MMIRHTAYADACELMMPRTSGPSVNVHVIKPQFTPKPNYERMRDQIKGREEQEAPRK